VRRRWRRSGLRRWWKALHAPRCGRCGSADWDVKQFLYLCAGCGAMWPVQEVMPWADRADQWIWRHRVLMGIAAVVFLVAAAAALGRPGPG
jgi:hypothetical protein